MNPILPQVRSSGIIAIMRASSSETLIEAAEALYAGGVVIIEVTLTTPGALHVIEQARGKLTSQMYFGAGSILDAESARAAILAGAQFIVSPSCNIQVIEICRRYSVPVFPGAYTPTEIITAWEAGADMVKIFPASIGGPAFIKALKAPLPQVEMVPVGGIELENTASYIQAGAAAVGVGSSLVNDKLLKQGNFAAITRQAQEFLAQVQLGRSKS
jgi:2-dehydro-3-deoxyphosphogluconate aldolase / (4S)-4-hydroxy-2-oxoglutarate aldolase